MMISPSGIKEAGKSIAELSERTRAASTGDSTALLSWLGEARRGLSRETNRLCEILLKYGSYYVIVDGKEWSGTTT